MTQKGNPGGLWSDTLKPTVRYRHLMPGMITNGTSTVARSVMGTGDQYAIFAMVQIEKTEAFDGILIPQAVNPASGESDDWNLGIWTTAINGNDWNPAALIPGAEGTLNVAPVTGNIRGRLIQFAAPVTIRRGWYFVGGLYRCNVGVTAGQYYTVGLHGPERLLNGGTAGYSRYDQRSSAVVAYSASSLANLLSGMSFVDNATFGAGAPQNINFGLKVA